MNILHNSRFWKRTLIAMFIPLGLVAFWPTPVDQPIGGQLASVLSFLHRQGIPRWFDYSFIEASANVVLFVPLGCVACLAFPSKRWWQIGAFGLLVSSCIELGQHQFLNDRFASPSDIVTNTLGAVAGALLVKLGRQSKEVRCLPATDL